MARELVVLWAGRHRRGEWETLYERYRRRIRRHVELRERGIRIRSRAAGTARLQAEGEALLAALADGSWSVALDRRGTMRGSRELAAWLERVLIDSPHGIAFLIGSDLGLAESVREGSRELLSLGPLTLPHELARLVLYEQLYRALTLLAGIKYHRS